MTAPRPLCHRDTLADGQARGFDLEGEGQDQFFLVRHGGVLHAWRNACPHVNGAPMAWRRDAYLSPDGRQVMCHAHGARFEPDTGRCVQGPCLGQHLQPVALHTDAQGQVWRAVDWAACNDNDNDDDDDDDDETDRKDFPMTAVNKALVVGGGFSGMAAAIRMRRAGIEVHLLEQDAAWCPLGAGISVSGATLRALESLGLRAAFEAEGYTSNNVEVFTAQGHPIGTLPTPPVVGSSVPGGAGILRPALARIMAEATRAAGTQVRLGQQWTDMEQDGQQVHVRFSDGSQDRFDLVVGADGVHSALRAKYMPEVPAPEYIGQGVWRAVLPRPEVVQRPCMWLGQHIKVGVNPVSATHMYLFITEDRPTKEHIDAATWPAVVEGLLRPFTDPLVQSLIPHVHSPEAAIDYRPLANLLVPAPWNRGRVLLIGDAVAATTPHLASGAGIGIESGIVLGEELERHDDLQAALDAFHARRFERCRMVVKNSEQLCLIEIHGGDKAEHQRIMRESILALTQPI